MSKILAIDYGTKKVGVAISDESRKIAFSLKTVLNSQIFPFLSELMSQETISTIVIGNPLKLNSNENKLSNDVNIFINKLNQKFSDIEILKFDERFTSVIAKKTILESGISKMKRRNKILVDKISATIILQDYISSLR